MLDTTSPEALRTEAHRVASGTIYPDRVGLERAIYAALCDAIEEERTRCRGIAADYCTSSSLECARLIFNRPSPRRDHQGERR